jgi:hypothetical protein
VSSSEEKKRKEKKRKEKKGTYDKSILCSRSTALYIRIIQTSLSMGSELIKQAWIVKLASY